MISKESVEVYKRERKARALSPSPSSLSRVWYSFVPQTPIHTHRGSGNSIEGLVISCTTSCSKLECGATNQIA